MNKITSHRPKRHEDIVRARLGLFRRSEDGNLMIFGLFIFLLMLMIGGLAVDLMRLETARVKIQGTADRCSLAAADLDQKGTPLDVVTDCFTKAGLIEYMDGPPTVDQGINYRIVTAHAKAQVPMLFSNLLSVFGPTAEFGTLDVLTVPAVATAEERITDVEISLVVDMSSSMQQNNKLQNLRSAATDFVGTVLQNNDPSSPGLTTVSMVPYSAVVNPGPVLAPYYAMTNEHDYSTCPLIETSEFNDTWINPGVTHQIVSHFEWSGANGAMTRPWCFEPDDNPIVVHSSDEVELTTAIADLKSYGNTAIDLGMIWGATLLDPRTRPTVTSMIANGDVQSDSVGRPVNWDVTDTLKVIVLMTDGENTTEYDLCDNCNGINFKTDMSSVWVYKDRAGDSLFETDNDLFSVWYQGQDTNSRNDDKFMWLGHSGNGRWRNFPQGFPGGQSGYRNTSTPAVVPGHGYDYSSKVRHLSWQDIFATWPQRSVYSRFFTEPYNEGKIDYTTYAQTYYADEDVVNSTQADNRLASICQAAKDEGAVIYTVAFEAPAGGQAALLDCASSPSNYFNVAGTNISSAFAAIASDIANLKLTQ